MNKARVLFLCTANSCRSQMAEGFLRTLAGDRFEVTSAGTTPTKLNPDAVRAMDEVGIDISGQKAKDSAEFSRERFQYVITVCKKAKERCPIFPGAIWLRQEFAVHRNRTRALFITGSSLFSREVRRLVDLLSKRQILKKVRSVVTNADNMENRLTPVQMSKAKENAAPAIWSKPRVRRSFARDCRDFSPSMTVKCIRISEYKGQKNTTPDNNRQIFGRALHAWHRPQFQEHPESNCLSTSKCCGGKRFWQEPADNAPKARSFVFRPIPLSSNNSSGATRSAEEPVGPSPSPPHTFRRALEDRGSAAESGPKTP